MIYQIVLSYFAMQQEQEDVWEYVLSGQFAKDAMGDLRAADIEKIENEFRR